MRKFRARQETVPNTEEGPKKLRALIPLHKPDTEEQATQVFWRRAQTGREAPSMVDMQEPTKEVRESL